MKITNIWGMIQASFCNIWNVLWCGKLQDLKCYHLNLKCYHLDLKCYHLILSHGIFLTVRLLRSKVTYCFIHPRLKKKRWCFAGLPHSTERSGLYVVVVRPVFAGRFSFSALVSTQHTAENAVSAWEPWESTAENAISAWEPGNQLWTCWLHSWDAYLETFYNGNF